MDSYPCPACGGRATETTGCQNCGRPHDTDAAALALFRRTVASLEAKKRNLTADQKLVATQMAHATAQRDSLRRKILDRLATEEAADPASRARRRDLIRMRRRDRTDLTPLPGPLPGPGSVDQDDQDDQMVADLAPQDIQPAAAAPQTSVSTDRPRPPGPQVAQDQPSGAPIQPVPRTPGTTGRRPGRPSNAPHPGRPTPARPVGPRSPQVDAARPLNQPFEADLVLPGAETSPGSMQTVLLSLGGLLLAGAAVVLTVIAFATVGAAGRITLLTLVTGVALGLPVLLTRRNLAATAETVAAVALLLVLLDGYVVWTLRLFGAAAIPDTTYFGLVCLVTAGLSIGYHATSHLVAPRFATVLVLQPVLPLLAYPALHDPAAWALVLAGVAAIDLGFGAGWWRLLRARPTFTRPTPDAGAPAAPAGAAQRGTDQHNTGQRGTDQRDPGQIGWAPVELADLIVRNVSWFLFSLGYASGLLCATVGLITVNSLSPALRLAAVLLVIATLGVIGGVIWRRAPVPDVAGGIATVALILAVARVGAIAVPGHTLIVTACAVMVAAVLIPLLPPEARRGPTIAGAVAACGSGVLLAIAAVPAVTAPLRAIAPVWHSDLATYHARVAQSAGHGLWQLVAAGLLLTAAAAIMLPVPVRPDGVVIGATITMLCTPAALSLSWFVGPTVAVASAVAIITVALNVPRSYTATTCVTCAIILGGYAAAISLTQPTATALTLAELTIAGTAIAFSPWAARPMPATAQVVRRVTDVAGAGAIFAMPGAAAAGAATLFSSGAAATRTPVVLVASFIALAVSVGAAALVQLARGTQSLSLLIGAAMATFGVLIATFFVPGATAMDMEVGLLMACGTILLWLAPWIDSHQTFGPAFKGADAATAALTVATIGAVVRAAVLAAPSAKMVAVAMLVLITSVALQILPGPWRRGPIAGGAIVGCAIVLYAGAYAAAGAVGVVRAASPIWHAQTGWNWQHTAEQYMEFGGQVPVSLLLLSVAAAVALPALASDAVCATTLALAVASLPVGFKLGWTSPMILGWITVTGLALSAILARSPRAAYIRLAVAGGLCLETVTASLARPGSTAGTLIGLGASGVMVAILGASLGNARARRDRTDRAHLVVVGGSGAALALVLFPAAIAAIAANAGRESWFVATSALATAALGLAIAGSACQKHRVYLPFVSGGTAAAGILIVLISVPTPLPTVVYAAAAALLGVLAELIRAGTRTVIPPAGHGRGFSPEAGGRGARMLEQIRTRRPAGEPGGFGIGVAAAAGVPAAVALVKVAPAVVAGLIGPYRWIAVPWTGTTQNGANLGWFHGWTGNSADVLAAFVLTIAAALVAVGLGGDSTVIANRAVSVIIPGIAITLLIAPAALHLGYPAQPFAALLVAALAGLAIALAPPPDDAPAASPLMAGRRLAFVIAILAGGAALTGSLATPRQTVYALACTVLASCLGAFRGRTLVSRMVSWQVAAGAAELLALAAGLANHLPAARCAYPVLLVSGALISFAGLLPRFRRTPSIDREVTMIESIAFVGVASAAGLTLGSVADTAAIGFAAGAILGLAAARPGRGYSTRTALVITAAGAELVAIWLLLIAVHHARPELYTLPFAALALIVGLVDLRRRPEMGSAVAYGPALVTAFAPTLYLVLSSDSTTLRRVLLIVAAVITVAIGAWHQQQAPVVIGFAVTAVGMAHELILLGRLLPWPILLVLFTAAGALLIGLGATYEKRRKKVKRVRGALGPRSR